MGTAEPTLIESPIKPEDLEPVIALAGSSDEGSQAKGAATLGDDSQDKVDESVEVNERVEEGAEAVEQPARGVSTAPQYNSLPDRQVETFGIWAPSSIPVAQGTPPAQP
eukprot:11756044-Alexandrium_andersonii.AAC.1